MNTRGLPGTLAPRYQELQPADARIVPSASDQAWATQSAWASGTGSIVRYPSWREVVEAVRDPLHVLLDGYHHVREHRWAAGAGDGEQVRETRDLQPQHARRPVGPGVLAVADRLGRGCRSGSARRSSRRTRWRTRSRPGRCARTRCGRRSGLCRGVGCVERSTRVTLSRLKVSK